MSGKTVWVVGGLVLAVSAVAYLSYHETPSGKDAAGTIVAAKRAYVDGTSASGGGSTVGTSSTGTDTDASGNTSDRSGGVGADKGEKALMSEKSEKALLGEKSEKALLGEKAEKALMSEKAERASN